VLREHFLLVVSHDLLSSFVKFQLIAHLLHRSGECFNLLLLMCDGDCKIFLLPRLRLDENAEERTARRRFRTEIAHETIFRPNLDVTGCAIRIINQD
jgi:hypothetical protein